jgi:hypothetical protein
MHEIKENADDDLDQSAFANLNADWVNYKGSKTYIHAFQDYRADAAIPLLLHCRRLAHPRCPDCCRQSSGG